MIFVERSKVPASLNPDDENSAGAKERARFVDAFNTEGNLPETKDYRAYAGDDVREALTVLFHGKCAYCESGISGSSQTDIEHFRPKGGVKDADDAGVTHPGYWWLAMSWDNLLLSCMHCNQHRRQLIMGSGLTTQEIQDAILDNDLQTTGKKNAFPTADGQYVTTYDGKVADEKPLLIDPTKIDPAGLFDWEFEGELSTVKAKNGDARAEKTKDVLGFNRRHLTEDRAKTVLLMRSLASDVREAVDCMSRALNDEVADAHRASAIRSLKSLAEFARKENNFAGMARAFLDEVRGTVAAAL
ncbi:hypothetical protein [Sphingomonas sp. PP-CE-1G-424]|uniref:hypothetical protein n=1 Tax=Sphingomonas sp. PP-CE-1G-424 TaxID=2135658 RepID=UPI001054902C|nr:hypothetical protein [Sphingomonas sp. PP-CE-1G-424]TCP64797.1 uncharacterized protein (TIGR02646 family) [Sphingomonas sp. PP-CE-1G-424]